MWVLRAYRARTNRLDFRSVISSKIVKPKGTRRSPRQSIEDKLDELSRVSPRHRALKNTTKTRLRESTGL